MVPPFPWADRPAAAPVHPPARHPAAAGRRFVRNRPNPAPCVGDSGRGCAERRLRVCAGARGGAGGRGTGSIPAAAPRRSAATTWFARWAATEEVPGDVLDNATRQMDSPVLVFSGAGCVGGSAEAVVPRRLGGAPDVLRDPGHRPGKRGAMQKRQAGGSAAHTLGRRAANPSSNAPARQRQRLTSPARRIGSVSYLYRAAVTDATKTAW